MASHFYARYVPPPKRSLSHAQDAAELNEIPLIPVLATAPPSIKKDASLTYHRYLPPPKSDEKHTENNLESAPTSILKRKLDNVTNPDPAIDLERAKQGNKEGNDHAKQAKKRKLTEKKDRKPKATHTEEEECAEQRKGTLTIPAVAWDHSPPVPSNVSSDTEPSQLNEGRKSKHRHGEKVSGILKNEAVLSNEAGFSNEGRHKYKSVLERREKALKKAERYADRKVAEGNHEGNSENSPLQQPIEVHDLVPLPQPEPKPLLPALSILSALPPWLSSPIRVSPTSTTAFSDLGVPSHAADILKEHGFKEAFAVQAAVLPLLLPGPNRRPGDLLVSAATGSGKTLSYVLPMVEDISHDTVPRLRGLIVVPTRDLVAQAKQVCNVCVKAITGAERRHVRIGTAAGNETFRIEQAQLISEEPRYDLESYNERRRVLNAKWENSDWGSDDENSFMCSEEAVPSLPGHVIEYKSTVDILICTPGRLVEHLKSTPGFTLEYVRWLVIDEADKLIDQSFQEWLGSMMAALEARKLPSSTRNRIQKIVLSATLTRDIGQINDLKLHRPMFIMLEGASQDQDNHEVSEAHTLPSHLSEFAVKVDDDNLKPLILLELLKAKNIVSTASEPILADNDDDTTSSGSSESTYSSASESGISSSTSSRATSSEFEFSTSLGPTNVSTATTPPVSRGVLIFTASTTATLRLTRLLTLLHPPFATSIAPLTSSTPTSTRNRTLRLFSNHKIEILIASDLVSRGLDLPSLKHVINYDVPTSVKAYVHRVGRTARAGKDGCAWTLLGKREARWFWGNIARGNALKREGNVKRVDGISKGITDAATANYESALEKLRRETKADRVDLTACTVNYASRE